MSNVNPSPMSEAVVMASLHAKMDNLMSSTNAKIDTLIVASNATHEQLADDMLASLESRLTALEENKPAVVDMSVELKLLKQQQLKNSICFNGIPLVDGENITNILNAI